jgi:hypothetical protein
MKKTFWIFLVLASSFGTKLSFAGDFDKLDIPHDELVRAKSAVGEVVNAIEKNDDIGDAGLCLYIGKSVAQYNNAFHELTTIRNAQKEGSDIYKKLEKVLEVGNFYSELNTKLEAYCFHQPEAKFSELSSDERALVKNGKQFAEGILASIQQINANKD